ncbi:hypothetical protein BDZ97DRAFT_1860465, partial [Flammula alnicola]
FGTPLTSVSSSVVDNLQTQLRGVQSHLSSPTNHTNHSFTLSTRKSDHDLEHEPRGVEDNADGCDGNASSTSTTVPCKLQSAEENRNHKPGATTQERQTRELSDDVSAFHELTVGNEGRMLEEKADDSRTADAATNPEAKGQRCESLAVGRPHLLAWAYDTQTLMARQTSLRRYSTHIGAHYYHHTAKSHHL